MGSPRDEIVRVVSDVLAPLVRADGGEIWLVQADDRSVSLHLGGRFSGCPGNTLAKRHVIEPAILSVAPDAKVVVTSGALVPPGAQRA